MSHHLFLKPWADLCVSQPLAAAVFPPFLGSFFSVSHLYLVLFGGFFGGFFLANTVLSCSFREPTEASSFVPIHTFEGGFSLQIIKLFEVKPWFGVIYKSLPEAARLCHVARLTASVNRTMRCTDHSRCCLADSGLTGNKRSVFSLPLSLFGAKSPDMTMTKHLSHFNGIIMGL